MMKHEESIIGRNNSWYLCLFAMIAWYRRRIDEGIVCFALLDETDCLGRQWRSLWIDRQQSLVCWHIIFRCMLEFDKNGGY